MCKRLLADFEVVAGKNKYVSDFFIFLRESKLDDFMEVDQETIQVSTMHRAKGREFDTVIIMLDAFNDLSEENKRVLYVAMTRAKEFLQIHYRDISLHQKFAGFNSEIGSKNSSEYNSEYSFNAAESKVEYNIARHVDTQDSYNDKPENTSDSHGPYNDKPAYASGIQGILMSEVTNSYKTKSKIVFQLGYADIFLSFFYDEKVKECVEELCSGDELQVNKKGCKDLKGKEVLIFSKGFREQLQKYLDKGYMFKDAKVHMVVYWSPVEQDGEVRVVMPIIRLEEC